MKKITTILLLILFLSASSPAYAALGFFKPDSKLYFLQPILESARLFFSFSKEAKADYLLELAERRADEMTVAPSEEIANRYTEHFRQLEEITQQTEEAKRKEITERIREANLRQQEVLARVYNQVSEQAREMISNAQENSSKHVEQTIQTVEGAEEAEDYAAEAVRIQEIGKSGRIEQLEQMRQAPMQSSPQANPSESVPKTSQPAKELKAGRELKSLNPSLEEEQGESDEKQIMQPVQPVPMQTPERTR